MFSEAAPEGDWALAENQMPDRQIAPKVIESSEDHVPSLSDQGV